jgi:hypothetical protein
MTGGVRHRLVSAAPLLAACCALPPLAHANAGEDAARPAAYVQLATGAVSYGDGAASGAPSVYVDLPAGPTRLAQAAPMAPAPSGAMPPTPEERRIPGQAPPAAVPLPVLGNPNAVPPPQPTTSDTFIPIPDRWRLLDALGRKENIFDPYNTNTYKGDKPIFGHDWFFELSAISDTVYEPARVPTPVAPQASARQNSSDVFGKYGRTLVSQTGILSLDLFKGDTAYKPPELEFRLVPVFNFNHTEVEELGLLNTNPAEGLVRNDSFPALQEAFVDYHIHNVSTRYDFDSIRVGIQPFSTDFRGFLFQDSQLGVRLFGNRDNNRWQYNLAYFRRIEKDTNSGLNDIVKRLRKDDIYIANVYRQDLPVPGFTSQLTFVRNVNREGNDVYYNNNNFLVRPQPFGDFRGYNYQVNYLGLNGDGHFGRINLTTSAYWAFGHQDHNPFSSMPNSGQTISAFFVAAEPSIDFDWIRVRLSALYASGDGNPQGGRATGFDAIFENPQFAGADTSYWIRQGIPLIGGGTIALSQPNGVLADLRASKDEGQSNFINPGLELLGIGADFDILPELRVATNFNYLRFVNTAPLQFLRHQSNIPNDIGYDMSVAVTYRPLDSQNIVLRLSGAVLAPGDGLKALYQTGDSTPFTGGNFLYSVLFNVILTY